jgi:hypothetical protein
MSVFVIEQEAVSIFVNSDGLVAIRVVFDGTEVEGKTNKNHTFQLNTAFGGTRDGFLPLVQDIDTVKLNSVQLLELINAKVWEV